MREIVHALPAGTGVSHRLLSVIIGQIHQHLVKLIKNQMRLPRDIASLPFAGGSVVSAIVLQLKMKEAGGVPAKHIMSPGTITPVPDLFLYLRGLKIECMGFFSSLFSPVNRENALDEQQKNDRRNFDILKYDGIRAQNMRKTEYAIRCFTEALKIRKDFETMKYLMSAYFMLHQFDDALEVLNEMTETGEEPANTLLMRANLLYTLNRNEEAVADCAKVIESEPDNYFAYFQSAKSQRTLGNLPAGIENLTKAIGLKEDFSGAYMLRAEIYLSLKKGNESLSDAEKVIALTPDDETAYLLRGRARELLGDVAGAFLDYKEASELNPFNEEAYLLSGRLMMAQEKYDEAIALFDEAIEHNEQFAKAYAERAHAKEQTGDKEGASADRKKSEKLNADAEEKPENQNFDYLYKGNII